MLSNFRKIQSLLGSLLTSFSNRTFHSLLEGCINLEEDLVGYAGLAPANSVSTYSTQSQSADIPVAPTLGSTFGVGVAPPGVLATP